MFSNYALEDIKLVVKALIAECLILKSPVRLHISLIGRPKRGNEMGNENQKIHLENEIETNKESFDD